MTVYIDVLIILNIYITYFTLRAVSRILHTRITFRRTALASVFGGFASLAAMLGAGMVTSLLLKAALTVITVLAAFGFGSFRLLALRSFVSIAVSMLICGAAVLIHELTGSDIVFSANGYVYMSISALVLVISSAVIYGALSLLRRFTDSPEADERVLLTIEDHGRSTEVAAVADSGNYLRDFLTGRPVIVCRAEAVGQVMPENAAAYLRGCTDDVSGIRLIPMRTASGGAVIPAFRPGKVTALFRGESITLDALIGVSGAFENDGFDAVIPAKLLM
ncbi:MAG: sigma-E processing peptidase SpoIIGA [Ruminiclostridium sp.]|nr:sigma-E processing peptidase SpoIIGA [Ruminiclostridium sp.]